jgi:hypothetical protein
MGSTVSRFFVIFKLDSYFLFKLKGYFLYFTPYVHSMPNLRIHFRLVLIIYWFISLHTCCCLARIGTLRKCSNSEHRKMRAKQQHVCNEMNQYMINTNRKWILRFGIEWTYEECLTIVHFLNKLIVSCKEAVRCPF